MRTVRDVAAYIMETISLASLDGGRTASTQHITMSATAEGFIIRGLEFDRVSDHDRAPGLASANSFFLALSSG